MRKITLICVGNLKEKYLQDAVAEYQKRLGKFFDFTLVEIGESKLQGRVSQGEIDKALKAEAEKILQKIKGKNVCSLCVEGKQKTSEDFADFIAQSTDNGELFFVIGSSYGLDAQIKENSVQLSFSKMTFPHQLMRVIFLEQLYRAGTIIYNIEYHK